MSKKILLTVLVCSLLAGCGNPKFTLNECAENASKKNEAPGWYKDLPCIVPTLVYKF